MYTITKGKWSSKGVLTQLLIFDIFRIFACLIWKHARILLLKMSSFFLIQYISSISDKITIPFRSLHHLPIGFLTSFLSRSCVCLSLANLLTRSLYLYLSSMSFIVDWTCMVLFVNWKTFSTLSKSLSYILIYDFRFIYDVNITFYVNMSKRCCFALIYISFKMK